VPAGSSTVEITLEPVDGGTEVRLRHSGLPAGEPPLAHLAGWRHAMATLAYAGSADQLAPVLGERVADWLAAWNEPDPGRREALLSRCLAAGGRFRDPTAAVDGAGPLADHIGMVQRMAGGARLVGRGAPEPCHGLVRFGWAAVGPGEVVVATGTNVAGVDLDGRFRWVTGFWDPTPAPPEAPPQP
jgi:Activator of Hsp90 ATPase homolog 1-like protein